MVIAIKTKEIKGFIDIASINSFSVFRRCSIIIKSVIITMLKEKIKLSTMRYTIKDIISIYKEPITNNEVK